MQNGTVTATTGTWNSEANIKAEYMKYRVGLETLLFHVYPKLC